MSAERFVEMLTASVPALAPIYREHLNDQDGELLPHVLMGDFTRGILALHRDAIAGVPGAEQALSRALALLDEGMGSGDEPVENLVSLSFLENLERDDPAYPDLKRRFGPALMRELKVMDDWRPGID
jgi:hypothetical protein